MVGHGEPFGGDDPFPADMDPPELLLEATVRVLSAEGIQGLTLRKVAEKAEKNRGLVHYYFESKSHLLASLLDHILEGTRELMDLDSADDPTEQLWRALTFHAYGPGGEDSAGRHYYEALLQLQALAANDEEIRRRLTRNHRYLVEVVSDIIRKGIANGSFRQTDPEALAMFLLSAIDGARTVDLATDIDSARKLTLERLDEYLKQTLYVD